MQHSREAISWGYIAQDPKTSVLQERVRLASPYGNTGREGSIFGIDVYGIYQGSIWVHGCSFFAQVLTPLGAIAGSLDWLSGFSSCRGSLLLWAYGHSSLCCVYAKGVEPRQLDSTSFSKRSLFLWYRVFDGIDPKSNRSRGHILIPGLTKIAWARLPTSHACKRSGSYISMYQLEPDLEN